MSGGSGFSFVYERHERLPALAWCLRVRAGSPGVAVQHGPGVETRPGAFVEGAWDAPYADFRFDRAIALAGTGARCAGDHVLLVAGTGRQDPVYVVRTEEELFASNSPVFALHAAGDEPDPAHRAYLTDLIAQAKAAGSSSKPRRLQMQRYVLELHDSVNLRIGADFGLEQELRPSPEPPQDYAAYVSLLEGVMARVFANATDSARARRYPPLATLSTGYDAPAIAALAARAGCREALTFAELMPGVAWPDDGSAIGERLGLRVLRRARDAWRLRSDLPEAEAWAWPPGQLVSQASVESDLAGRLLLTGRFGGRLLEPPDLGAGPHRPVGLPVLTAPSQVELRLRVGFLNLAPYFVSWNHLDAIQRLSSLPEMTPYRVGGTYDRPIPRRIVEEAGVPREAFGQVKRVGAALNVFHAHDLTPGSRRDFDAFLAAAPAPLRTSAGEKLRALWGQARVRAGAKPPSWRQSHEGRLYHWGFARTRPRYEV